MAQTLAEELTGMIQGEVLDDEETLKAFSTDASLFKVKPQLVVRPKDVADVQALVRFCCCRKREGSPDFSNRTGPPALTCPAAR